MAHVGMAGGNFWCKSLPHPTCDVYSSRKVHYQEPLIETVAKYNR